MGNLSAGVKKSAVLNIVLSKLVALKKEESALPDNDDPDYDSETQTEETSLGEQIGLLEDIIAEIKAL